MPRPVVDAPAIGPRMAERLERIGVKTVADLLALDPETAAGRLSHVRVSAQTVRDWQAQATLVCRVPMLRGHDAQILVAIGVTDANRLAAMTPEGLFDLVRPFTETKECDRIVRNGRTPNLAEVTDWIRWAGNSRACAPRNLQTFLHTAGTSLFGALACSQVGAFFLLLGPSARPSLTVGRRQAGMAQLIHQ